jgi:hypothetical protein
MNARCFDEPQVRRIVLGEVVIELLTKPSKVDLARTFWPRLVWERRDRVESELICRDGSIAHLPMLDFHVFKSPANQYIVEAVARRLFPDGSILLDSGESYHAYGTRLVTDCCDHAQMFFTLRRAPSCRECTLIPLSDVLRAIRSLCR